MVQQIFTLVPRLNPSLGFVTAQEIWSTENTNNNNNKRLLQQPALRAITLLRSFVAGKANFCSQLLASLVHFTEVKSQAILIIRLGVTEVISPVTLYIFCQLQNDEISTSLDMFRHNNFACGLCISIVALTATICL